MASGERGEGSRTVIDAVLQSRLDLLVSAGEITRRAQRLTEEVVGAVAEEFDLQLQEANGAQLVTHVALALTRVERGEPETTAIGAVDEEISAHERQLAFSRRVLGRCSQELGRPVPEAEISYLTLHLCALTV